jgi:hypothetical protein
VESEDPSACATVHLKVCGRAVLIVTKCNCKEAAINPNIRSRTHYSRHVYQPTRDNIYISLLLVFRKFPVLYCEQRREHPSMLLNLLYTVLRRLGSRTAPTMQKPWFIVSDEVQTLIIIFYCTF